MSGGEGATVDMKKWALGDEVKPTRLPDHAISLVICNFAEYSRKLLDQVEAPPEVNRPSYPVPTSRFGKLSSRPVRIDQQSQNVCVSLGSHPHNSRCPLPRRTRGLRAAERLAQISSILTNCLSTFRLRWPLRQRVLAPRLSLPTSGRTSQDQRSGVRRRSP